MAPAPTPDRTDLSAPATSVRAVTSATEISGRPDLADWRFLLGRVEARFRAGSYERAAAFVQRLVEVAAGGDRPDVDLRPPDRVVVSLPTSGLELAASVSSIAAATGVRSEPGRAMRLEVAVDALDIDAVLPFWRAVLGYDDEVPAAGERVVAVVDPERIGPAVWFQQLDEPRPQRNRIHLDVTVPHDQAESRVATAIAAGGHLLSDDHARAFWVLADPEGNEACVCTWQDRGPGTD